LLSAGSSQNFAVYTDRNWEDQLMKRMIVAASIFLTCTLLAQTQLKQAAPEQSKNPLAMDFVKIAPGEFMMGCSVGDIDCNEDERPIHRVQLTKAFEMGKFEVTQAQWMSVMGSNPSTTKGDDRPVETVSKIDAQEFLDKLNARSDGYRYRLPTEAEWEYAARAGTKEPYAGRLDEIAWYAGNSEDETHPVGKKKPNAWGLYDMQGNVREWVADWYSANYYGRSPAADPTGPAQGERGGRGPRGDGRGGRGPRGGPPGGFRGGDRGGFDGPPPPPPGDFQNGPPPPPPDGNGTDGTGGFPPRGGRRGFGGRRGPGGPGFPGGPDGRGGPGGRGGLQGGLGVMRGGAWDNPAPFVRISSRYNYYGPTLRVSDVGFRVVREKV
jgi:formylglycine-generating enzyme required for sulfatase activity